MINILQIIYILHPWIMCIDMITYICSLLSPTINLFRCSSAVGRLHSSPVINFVVLLATGALVTSDVVVTFDVSVIHGVLMIFDVLVGSGIIWFIDKLEDSVTNFFYLCTL